VTSTVIGHKTQVAGQLHSGMLRHLTVARIGGIRAIIGRLKNPMLSRLTACLAGSGLITGYFLLYRGFNLARVGPGRNHPLCARPLTFIVPLFIRK